MNDFIPWVQVTASPLLESIKNDWSVLLSDSSKNEGAYQSFLENHAGFFFPVGQRNEGLVFSELELGADRRIDFGIASSQRSYGLVYTLIEIETPHESAFKKNGDPRGRLNHALQQVRDWKRWIEENSDEAKRLFPSKKHTIFGERHFEYMVIMGRRNDESAQLAHRRNQLSTDTGVEIRSFDWFTDNLMRRNYSSFTSFTADFIEPTCTEDNRFTSPFMRSMSSKQWRAFVGDHRLSLSHMVGANMAILKDIVQFDSNYEEAFMRYVQTLPEELQVPLEHEMREVSLRYLI